MRVTGKQIRSALILDAEHILYSHKGDWYHNLARFPGILADKEGYVRFETETSYISNHLLKHGKHLHVNDGIRSLPDYIEFTEEEKFILDQLSNNEDNSNDQAERRPRNIDSIVRNQKLVRQIKKLRNHACQICQERLKIGNNSFYSEVHHIMPLGEPHHGPDVKENMMCVCPNCHIKLDYGFTAIVFENIRQLSNHRISKVYVDYHNANLR